ncbi:MAG: hypothetical protein LUG44_05605 [Clostridiales bacterium]|nr:hypothetical protein [Clostridiales bacterium]
MTKKKTDQTALALLSIKAQIAQLEAEAEALTDALKGAMVEAGREELAGDGWTASYKSLTQKRFDTAAFRAEHPRLAGKYMKQTTQTRFTIR